MRKVRRIASGWTTKQAAQLAGMKPKTLAVWLERGVVSVRVSHGKGRGRGCRFTDTDVVGLSIMAHLRKQGVSLQRLRPMLKELRRVTGRESNLSAVAASRLLLMDNELYSVGDDAELVNLLTGQHVMQPVLCPPLVDVLRQIRERANQDETLRERFERLDDDNILRAA